ncbi:hypothetical protein RIF29_17341 [Crotalaria pallida]|uniref:Uncharacterized protein n=1 Tax=Crotalaria pallida TaxID=3830 RepID=A0AAN9IGC7_CROPI
MSGSSSRKVNKPYKCNKNLVIPLNPLPHNGSALNPEAMSCTICNRKLTEPHLYIYCSISCKVKAVLDKADDSVPPFISIQSPPPHEVQEEETTEEPQKEETPPPPKPESLRKRKRKGTPHRAPFF